MPGLRFNPFLIALGLCASTGFAPFVLKAADADADREREAREAEAEDEAEKKLSEVDQILALKMLSGRLDLNAAEQGSDVVGALSAEDGIVYLLKLADKGLMKRLQTFNGKTVTLSGKLRNNNKYLIVSAIADPGGGSAQERTKRGGI